MGYASPGRQSHQRRCDRVTCSDPQAADVGDQGAVPADGRGLRFVSVATARTIVCSVAGESRAHKTSRVASRFTISSV
jgi:hypothetical protein